MPGFLVAFWLAGRYGARLPTAGSAWRRAVGVCVDCVTLVRHLFTAAFKPPPAVWGMAVFWIGEMAAVWAGMAAFGYRMAPAQLVLGVGTGMVFTRRTGPLAGAGVLILTLSSSIYYGGAPLAVALPGVFAYRVLSVWLPIPQAVSQLPRLRELVRPEIAAVAADRSLSPNTLLRDRRAS